MRPLIVFAVLAPVALAACGSDKERDKTIVVNPPTQTQTNPPQNNTVVVPGGGTKVCPPGYTAC